MIAPESRIELYKYILAGCLAFAVDFLILVGLTELAGFNYLLANLFSVSAGILVSYVLCIKWVFNHRKFSSVIFELPVFIVTCLIGIGLNEVLLWFLVSLSSMYYMLAKIIVTGMVFMVNFLLKKTVLFSRR